MGKPSPEISETAPAANITVAASTSSPSLSTVAPARHSSSKPVGQIVTVFVLLLAVVLVGICHCYHKRREKRRKRPRVSPRQRLQGTIPPSTGGGVTSPTSAPGVGLNLQPPSSSISDNPQQKHRDDQHPQQSLETTNTPSKAQRRLASPAKPEDDQHPQQSPEMADTPNKAQRQPQDQATLPPKPISRREVELNQQSLSSSVQTPLETGRPNLGLSPTSFTYEELASATNKFSELLGQGGFGKVHKGILPNKKSVAVKQLEYGSSQGEREFKAEVEVISRVHHKHLVSLVGYCIAKAHRMLVYDYVSNNTLEFHLHDIPERGGPTLDWPKRMKIAIGSAKALEYLHEGCKTKIIHRDIKATNILLDDNFEAKVADFGLAKSALDADSHVFTEVRGTFGYYDPAYLATKQLTEKTDVYCFGIVLLELITGRKPCDNGGIVNWAGSLLSEALKSKNFGALADRRLQENYNSDEMFRMIACAACCVRYTAQLRPQMSQVVRALEGLLSLKVLNEGSPPGHSRTLNEDLRRLFTTMLARGVGTSEWVGTSSDDQYQSASSSSVQQNTQET